MSPRDTGNFSQEDCESVERERLKQDDESDLPWLDESDIVAHEYDSDDPWVDEG